MATYLTEDIPLYICPECANFARAEHWVDDPYVGLCCEYCGCEVKYHKDEKATWWSVAVYETDRAYGGPEEGGWWYDCGHMIDCWKIRGFDNIEEARKYQQELRDFYIAEGAKNIAVRGFTEQLPDKGFPACKPVYC